MNCLKWDNSEGVQGPCRKLKPEAVSESFRHENDRSKEGNEWGVNDAMHSCPGGEKCGCKSSHLTNCGQKWDNAEEETSCRKLKPQAVTDSFKHENDRSKEGKNWRRHDANDSNADHSSN